MSVQKVTLYWVLFLDIAFIYIHNVCYVNVSVCNLVSERLNDELSFCFNYDNMIYFPLLNKD